MEHYKSRNNDYFHFTNPHDDVSDLDDDVYNESQYSDVIDDDERSCDFNFHTYRPLNSQTSGVMNRGDTVEIGGFDNRALMYQLDNTMKNIFNKLQHTIEGIGARVSQIEDDACKIDSCLEDVKNCEERYHATTNRKLREMQTVLQEVHDDVLFLRDKHEIAGTRLQLAILRGSKREKMNVSPQSSCSTPLFNQRSNELTLAQAVSYRPVVSQSHEITAQQYISPPFQQSHTPQFPHFVQSQLSNTSYIHTGSPRNYKSEFHAKYMPGFASSYNTHLRSELSSSYEFSNVKPVNSFLRPQEEGGRSNYIHTPVAQTSPHALPIAIDVKEESRSEEDGDTIPVDDIVDKVTGMGFRRDLVKACVRKLTVNGSRVDLNSVLDKMMNNK
ncbi:hypothetical protein M8C21_024954 [Ambrosia artemisiifolia]|uniref:DUF1421 domain-containing protein n=1 Tax=Ambrosia artemisiifolia TaxID=4212 RepID=A0AAD5CWR1_AMBAR|nr:hypothetical protein M8C21_024954 [Ambrosia artemisiifolia]